MSTDSVKTNLTLDEGSEVTVVRGGMRVEFNANGGVIVYQNDVPVYPATNDSTPQAKAAVITKADLQIGDKMEDGTIFGGISPDTGKPMYVRPADEPLTMKWKAAMDYAKKFEGHGHPAGTFRVPTSNELDVLFNNRAKIGGFNETGSNPAGWYWSSTQNDNLNAHGQSFSDGHGLRDSKSNHSSFRLVRS